MTRWFRRLKAALSIGTIWGTACALVGSVIGVFSGFGAGGLAASVLIGAAGFGMIGLVQGTAFSVLLTIADGRRSLEELTVGRAGMWGGLVGAGVPVVGTLLGMAVGAPAVPFATMIPVLLGAAVSYGTLTGLLAAGTVSIAKGAPDALSAGDSTMRTALGNLP